ncbi:MAG: dihydrolipoamide dehydrogenase [Bacillales bacterium]|jgi:dihydrolipoamide dehydrogenase|nr:dihydrolipoamide dehydrogenase [Bacillales bacterium]
MNTFDLVILGGGTGGYVAAIRASQMGLSVAIVEKNKLGGTCLHAGCIPSKALLRSAEVFHTAKKANEFGINISNIDYDFSAIMSRKNKIVDQLHKGVQHLMKIGKIQVFEGFGTIEKKDESEEHPVCIKVATNQNETTKITAKKCIIATGSRPRSLPGLEIDGNFVITSEEALQLEKLPNSMIIVGGGVIGIEWASILNDFGVEVTVLEYAPRIIPTEDVEISKEMLRCMKKRGVKVITGAKVLSETVLIENDKVSIQAEVKEAIQTYTAEQILVSVGRLANIEGFGIENTDIVIDRGTISVNGMMQTSDESFYAIGDVVGGLQLAHVASHEGIIAVEHIAGNSPHVLQNELVPKCIYSRPECSNVGLTEEAAIDKGYKVKTGKFFFRAIGKAMVYGETDGFVKFVSDADTGALLGVHMIGPHVTDMITEAELALLLKATSYQIGQMIHPHPSLTEAIGEAALAVDGLAIHN